MAYMSSEKKAELHPRIKAVLKKYNIKATLSVNNHSTLVLKIKQGAIDFISNTNRVVAARPGGFRNGIPAEKAISINPYWYHEHFDGKALSFLTEIMEAMNDGNHDRSDTMTDYFDVGWYTDVNIGNWKAPYALVK